MKYFVLSKIIKAFFQNGCWPKKKKGGFISATFINWCVHIVFDHDVCKRIWTDF